MIHSTSSEDEAEREAREQCPDDPPAMTGAEWEDEHGATHEECSGSTLRRPILMGQAEVIDLVLPEVRRMMEEEGMWMVSDPRGPDGAEVPVCSIQGKLYSMILDRELDPERFIHGIQVAGPLRAPETHEENDI